VLREERGTLLPRLRSPRSFFAFVLQQHPRDGEHALVRALSEAFPGASAVTAAPSIHRRFWSSVRVDASAAAKATSARSNAVLHAALSVF
jgi:hypothetical protein